ncbi:MAG TPA: endonuclease domain-containing protein [Rhodanobacteraceae bacterium]|nr:endonuclease domain-containing protein [Rhodanobacteraceae bacterium]
MREGARTRNAKRLRAAMTDAEKRLWYRLRRRQLANWRFRRQVPIGTYIVDFACVEAMLIVEVDGSQHLESATDRARDRWLQGEGYRVLRFWNDDVLARTEGVMTQILDALGSNRPLPPSGHLPPHAGEGIAGSGRG